MSDSENSVFCGADLDDRFARHDIRSMQAELFELSRDARNEPQLEQLFLAIESDELDIIQKLVESNSSIVNWTSTARHGNTPLHEAAERDLPDVVAFLLKSGANPEAATEFGLDPLAMCSTHGNSFSLIAQVVDLKKNDRRGAVTQDAGFYSF